MLLDIFMKKVFSRLWQWVSKYKRRLIYGALALFVGQICFFNFGWLGINNTVCAADSETPTQAWDFQEKATVWLQDFSFLNRACYILIYPILFLAWLLVNNSFVYAEVFSFDVILWQLWNVVRNLANYALWFIFVFKIFQYLINGQKSSDMSSLLKSSLIAWIWIQASWFLLAVLIDVSNILTYSVWWLPIHILGKDAGENKDFWNPYVFQTVVSADFSDPDTMHTYLANTSTWGNQWWSHFIAECETFSFKYDGGTEELIVAPKIVYYYDWENYHSTEQLKCHVWGDVFNFDVLAEWISRQDGPNLTRKDSQNKYNDSLDKAIKELKKKDKGWIIGDIGAWKVFQIKNSHKTWDDIRYHHTNLRQWLDIDNEINWSQWKMKRLESILEGDNGYVWVFSALYSSLLNAGKNFTLSEAWIYTSLLNTLLSLCHTIAVAIPLVAMLIVFLMRIWVIRMAIILSPAIILVRAFNFGDKVFKKGSVLEYLDVKNLIGIIFSPAIICFAVSISTVLVRILSTINAQDIVAESKSLFWWLITLNIAWAWVSIWNLICSAIWVAISWFLIRSAVKASALWKKVEWLEKLARSAIWSIPIIPVPWPNWKWVNYIGMDKAFGMNGQRGIFSEVTEDIKSTYGKQDSAAVQAWLHPEEERQKAETAKNNKQINDYKDKLITLSLNEINAGWVSREIDVWGWVKKSFNSMWDTDKRKILEAINWISDIDKIKKFGEAGDITIWWSEVWEFKDNKYVKKE